MQPTVVLHGSDAAAQLDSPGGATPGSIEPEGIAAELLALGYIIQIRDGTQPAKDSRSCLRTLKHRFLVCLGRQVRRRTGTCWRQTTAAAGDRSTGFPALRTRVASP